MLTVINKFIAYVLIVMNTLLCNLLIAIDILSVAKIQINTE